MSQHETQTHSNTIHLCFFQCNKLWWANTYSIYIYKCILMYNYPDKKKELTHPNSPQKRYVFSIAIFIQNPQTTTSAKIQSYIVMFNVDYTINIQLSSSETNKQTHTHEIFFHQYLSSSNYKHLGRKHAHTHTKTHLRWKKTAVIISLKHGKTYTHKLTNHNTWNTKL